MPPHFSSSSMNVCRLIKMVLFTFLYGYVFSAESALVNSHDDRPTKAIKSAGEKDWLGLMFVKKDSCIPTPILQYDTKLKKSTGSILETRGYKASLDGRGSAVYIINEQFFGLRALKMLIPSNTDILYMIAIDATPMELKKIIKQKTGVDIEILQDTTLFESTVPYIFTGENATTYFVCETMVSE